MKKIIPLLLLCIISPLKSYAACSGANCCSVSSGVTTLPSGDSCAILPDSYGITVYEKYLCTSEPTAPTSSANADLSMCFQTLSAPTGSTVRITESETGTFTEGTFTRPPNGVYTHGVVLIKNVFLLKYALQLNTAWDGTGGAASGTAGGNGVYCATLNVNKYEDEGLMMQCDSSPVTAGELGAGLSKFDTVGGNPVFSASESNLNGTGASIAGYLLNSDGNLATTTSQVKAYERLLGINTFAAPVVVTPQTSGFDMAFGINQGATIWSEGDSDSNGTENIGGGSGPFQVIVTPTNF
jgi:hypothetical protein